jgi:hypothetical protein
LRERNDGDAAAATAAAAHTQDLVKGEQFEI